MLKIVTGHKKGITIASTKSARELRPTQALIRQALVNILRNQDLLNSETKALDLYAGIGSVGLELLSNDVGQVVFVERDPRCFKILKSNIAKLGFNETVDANAGPQKKAAVIPKPVLSAFKILRADSKAEPFDLIFADPPYKDKGLERIIKEILGYAPEASEEARLPALLKIGGTLVWECSEGELWDDSLQAAFGELELEQVKKYGDSFLYFWRRTT